MEHSVAIPAATHTERRFVLLSARFNVQEILIGSSLADSLRPLTRETIERLIRDPMDFVAYEVHCSYDVDSMREEAKRALEIRK